jgi:hypothetical protein
VSSRMGMWVYLAYSDEGEAISLLRHERDCFVASLRRPLRSAQGKLFTAFRAGEGMLLAMTGKSNIVKT